MQAQVQEWNQQLAVCIPEAIAVQIQLEAGMNLDIEVIDGKLMLLPTDRTYKLNNLLAEITPENLHQAVESEDPIGQEAW